MRKFQLTIFTLSLFVLFVISLTMVIGQDDHGHSETDMTEDERMLLHEVRTTTAKYHELDVALEDGYGEFLSCFTYGDELGMGQHYVQGDLVSDDVLDPLMPESLVYEPRPDGGMTLIALEYLVFADVWDPENEGREAPILFGQNFTLETEIPDTPPVWALHVWLFTHNPDGLYAHFNPIVFCPDDAPVVDMANAGE